MRALSVRQPWAELIALGRKPFEIRSWTTGYRGPVLICAGQGWHKLGVRLHGKMGVRGVSVCIVELVDCRPVTLEDSAGACFNIDEAPEFKNGFAWVFANPRRVQRVPFKGKLSLFRPTIVPLFEETPTHELPGLQRGRSPDYG